MLPIDRLELALDIHGRSYRLLKWVANAVGKGFIPATRAHEYSNETAAARDWIESNYESLPRAERPSPDQLIPFANFFSTYLMSSFDIDAKPGMRLTSNTCCFCSTCSRLVQAPHLRAKTLGKRDKRRAGVLMCDRVQALGMEHGMQVDDQRAQAIVSGDLRRSCAYAAYGHWLIQRLDGHTDGPAILALWREFAWNKSGSPIPDFRLETKDFIAAETALVATLSKE